MLFQLASAGRSRQSSRCRTPAQETEAHQEADRGSRSSRRAPKPNLLLTQCFTANCIYRLKSDLVAARPVYTESLRPPAYKDGPCLRILTWNVASLNATLKKDPDAIGKLAAKEEADVICLQVSSLSIIQRMYYLMGEWHWLMAMCLACSAPRCARLAHLGSCRRQSCNGRRPRNLRLE